MNTDESGSSAATLNSKSTLTDEDFINYLHTKVNNKSLTNVLLNPNFYLQQKPWEILNNKNLDVDLYLFTMKSIQIHNSNRNHREITGKWVVKSSKTIRDSNTNEVIGIKITRFFVVPKRYGMETRISMLIVNEYKVKGNSSDEQKWVLCKIRGKKMEFGSCLGLKRRVEDDMDDDCMKRSKVFGLVSSFTLEKLVSRSEKESDTLLALQEWKPFGGNDSSLSVSCVLEEWKPFG